MHGEANVDGKDLSSLFETVSPEYFQDIVQTKFRNLLLYMPGVHQPLYSSSSLFKFERLGMRLPISHIGTTLAQEPASSVVALVQVQVSTKKLEAAAYWHRATICERRRGT